MSLSAEALALRKGYLGGSDCAAALGLSPWKTALELFHEKRGLESPDEPSEPMRWGTLLEPVIRQEYASRTGRQVTVPAEPLVHSQFPFMCANVDGLTHDGRLLEVKTARTAAQWGVPGTDEIPQHYLLQVQHYLAVTALPVADVAVLVGGCEYRQYEIPADLELQLLLIDAERDFWRCVETGSPPALDFDSPRALAIVRRLYPGTSGKSVTASVQDEHWRSVFMDAERLRGIHEQAADSAKAHLLHVMGEAAEMKFTDNTVLRRRQITKKAFSVPETSYVEARFIKAKE